MCIRCFLLKLEISGAHTYFFIEIMCVTFSFAPKCPCAVMTLRPSMMAPYYIINIKRKPTLLFINAPHVAATPLLIHPLQRIFDSLTCFFMFFKWKYPAVITSDSSGLFPFKKKLFSWEVLPEILYDRRQRKIQFRFLRFI